MKIFFQRRPRGIALIMVMVTIFVLTALVGAFALSMKVETKLASNASNESELEWLGRSGVELGKYVLALQLNSPQEPYDSLNQIWAGGPGSALSSNSPIASISLKDHKLGHGTYSVKITDLERKLNINTAANSPDVLSQAFIMMGADAGEYPQIVASIQDWIDADDDPHIGGAESAYYEGLTPPYKSKNGPLDDLSELLLVKGVTPEMYWGTHSSDAQASQQNQFDANAGLTNSVGLVDLFTPISDGKININTASAMEMQLIPGFDANMAQTIIQLRSGPDGSDGTEDDTPIGGTGGSLLDALTTATANRQFAQNIAKLFDVRSHTFEIEVDAEIASYKKTFVAIVARNSPQDIQVLTFRWK